ncbi:MAG: DUF3300 domain-containing protein [Terracidiphilus sp.]|jgi:hypothetical protein
MNQHFAPRACLSGRQTAWHCNLSGRLCGLFSRDAWLCWSFAAVALLVTVPAAQGQYGQQSYRTPTYSAPNQAPAGQGYGQGAAAASTDPDDPMQENGQAQYAQGAQAQPLAAAQLEQLLAPIALYPDTLVAQILAAATYPAQVASADHWLHAQGYAPADQIAAGADAQAWDPSVKALTAFPQVLAQMDYDLGWTTDLGNAYYNQPQDVLQTVQVLRQRAQAAGNLQSTPQESVSYNQGYIQVAPANPQVVYVPAYNPWDVYGQPVTPYHNFSLLGSLASLAETGASLGGSGFGGSGFGGSGAVRFGLGIAMAAFNHTPFGWATWALNWLTQSVLFHQSDYQSNSSSVAHWGGGWNGGPARPVAPRQQEAYGRQQFGQGENRGGAGYGRPATEYSREVYARQGGGRQENYGEARDYAGSRPAERAAQNYPARPEQYGRGATPVYGRPQAPIAMTAREQAYARQGYGGGFYGGAERAYASQPRQEWRAPAPATQRAPAMQGGGSFGQRGAISQRAYATQGGSGFAGRGFGESYGKQERSGGGFHFFGGGHSNYGGGHAPKSYGGGKGSGKSHSGGGHGGGGHHGGHRS